MKEEHCLPVKVHPCILLVRKAHLSISSGLILADFLTQCVQVIVRRHLGPIAASIQSASELSTLYVGERESALSLLQVVSLETLALRLLSIWNLSIDVNQNQRLQEEHHLFHNGSWP